MAQDAEMLVAHVRSKYPDAEAILSHTHAVAFTLMDSETAEGVWKKLATGLVRGDLLSVIEVGRDICTGHGGLTAWDARTRFLALREAEALS
jgi:hypothetical protein